MLVLTATRIQRNQGHAIKWVRESKQSRFKPSFIWVRVIDLTEDGLSRTEKEHQQHDVAVEKKKRDRKEEERHCCSFYII